MTARISRPEAVGVRSRTGHRSGPIVAVRGWSLRRVRGRRLGLADDIGIAQAGLVKGQTALNVLFGAYAQIRGFAPLVLGVKVLEERNAPLATGAGPEAFGDQRSDGGSSRDM